MRFLTLLAIATGLTVHIFGAAFFMAAGMWWIGVPWFIVGLTIEMWIWERDLA